MSIRTTSEFVGVMGLSLAVGISMALVMTDEHVRARVGDIPFFMPVYRLLHLPAKVLAESWHGLHLPPHGDAALLLYPRSVVVQWALIGSLVAGLRYYRRQHAKKPSPGIGDL